MIVTFCFSWTEIQQNNLFLEHRNRRLKVVTAQVKSFRHQGWYARPSCYTYINSIDCEKLFLEKKKNTLGTRVLYNTPYFCIYYLSSIYIVCRRRNKIISCVRYTCTYILYTYGFVCAYNTCTHNTFEHYSNMKYKYTLHIY